MKKASEYLKQLFQEPFQLEESTIEWDFLQVIKQAQSDIVIEFADWMNKNDILYYTNGEFGIDKLPITAKELFQQFLKDRNNE